MKTSSSQEPMFTMESPNPAKIRPSVSQELKVTFKSASSVKKSSSSQEPMFTMESPNPAKIRPTLSQETKATLGSPSPAKKRKIVTDVISNLQKFETDIDVTFRAALYSVDKGHKQQASETIKQASRKCKAISKQSVCILQRAVDLDACISQKMSTMEKYNSHLLLERNDFKRRLEALEEERDKLRGRIEVQGMERFLVDDFAEEKTETTKKD